jgi:hypothetical protein
MGVGRMTSGDQTATSVSHWPQGRLDAHRGCSALPLYGLVAPAARPRPSGGVPHVTSGAHLVP